MTAEQVRQAICCLYLASPVTTYANTHTSTTDAKMQRQPTHAAGIACGDGNYVIPAQSDAVCNKSIPAMSGKVSVKPIRRTLNNQQKTASAHAVC